MLATLLAFDERRPTWSVPQLATELAVPQSTMYRYIAQLRDVGLLDAVGGGEYRLSERVVGMARSVEGARAELVRVARPHLVALRDEIGETVLVCRRGGAFVYCVDRVESQRPVRLQFDPGQAMPVHAGASARVLLAATPRHERDALVAAVIDSLPAERRALLATEALDAVLAVGWTQSFEEVDEGIWGVAAAIRANGQVVASVGTAGPMYRLDEARRDDVIAAVQRAAERISTELR
jgi:DNA-binding IclR family transcriptional regulator